MEFTKKQNIQISCSIIIADGNHASFIYCTLCSSKRCAALMALGLGRTGICYPHGCCGLCIDPSEKIHTRFFGHLSERNT